MNVAHVVVPRLRGTRSIVEEDATNKLIRVFVPCNHSFETSSELDKGLKWTSLINKKN